MWCLPFTLWPAGCLLHVVLPEVWCKNVQHIAWSADFERWQLIVYIIWPWLLSQMVAVTCRTHHTQARHPLSLFHTHFLSHTPTHQPLYISCILECTFFNMPVVTASYCGRILPAAYPSIVVFLFFLFLVLSQKSHVSDTFPLILIPSGEIHCYISLPFLSFSYVVTAGFRKIQNLRIVCI